MPPPDTLQPPAAQRALTARSLGLGLPLLLLWIVLVSWSVPDGPLHEQQLVLIGGLGALFSLFALKFLLDFLRPAARPTAPEMAFIYALLVAGIPAAAMGRVALESAVANHIIGRVESGRRGMIPDFWAPNPHLGWLPELDPPDARCPYLELPPQEDGTPRRAPLDPPTLETSQEQARAAEESCRASLQAAQEAAEELPASREVLDTLAEMRRAHDLALRARDELAARPDPRRAAYVAWAAQIAGEKALRGPACVRNADVLHGYRKGKQAVPWSFWLKPLVYWFLVLLSFQFAMLMGMMLLRESWVEKERLPFPYARIAERVVHPLPGGGTDPERQESFPRLSSGIAFFVGLLFCVHGLVSIGQAPPVILPPAAALVDVDLTAFNWIPNVSIHLLLLPFALLVLLLFPLGLIGTAVFSFMLAAFGIPWIAALCGYAPILDIPFYILRMGGMLGISLSLLWVHRKELARLVTGLWRSAPADSPGAPLSPREISVGFFLSLGLFCALILAGGGDVEAALSSKLLMFAIVLVMLFLLNVPHARLRAYGAFQFFEFNLAMHTGMWFSWHVGGQVHSIPMAQGSPISQPDSFLHFHSLYRLETFGHYHQALGPGTQLLDASAFADTARARGRDIFKALGLALLLALLLAMPLFLIGVYHTGYDNTPMAGSWENVFVSTDKAYNYYIKTHPPIFTRTSFGWVLFGAALFATCIALRRRYARFPIEPMGLFLAGAETGRTVLGTDAIWFTVLVAFLIKWLLFRGYGVRWFQERATPWLVYALMGMTLGMLLHLFLSAVLLSQGWVF